MLLHLQQNCQYSVAILFDFACAKHYNMLLLLSILFGSITTSMQCIDVAYCYRCRVVMIVSCAKTAKPIMMLFGVWTRVGPRKQVPGGGQDPTGEEEIWQRASSGPLWSTGNVRHEQVIREVAAVMRPFAVSTTATCSLVQLLLQQTQAFFFSIKKTNFLNCGSSTARQQSVFLNSGIAVDYRD